MRAASLHEGEPRETLPIRRKAEEPQVNAKSETARILEEKHAPRPPPQGVPVNCPPPLAFQCREYPCVVTEIVDGDTLKVRIDLGLRVQTEYSLRLRGINAPEINTPAGQESLLHLLKILELLRPCLRLRTTPGKDHEKYGRFLGELLGVDNEGKIVNVNRRMVELGAAVESP